MSSNRISPEAQTQYIADGGVLCPFCQSHDITGGVITIDNGIASQDASCSDCNEEWTDLYSLTGVTTEFHEPWEVTESQDDKDLAEELAIVKRMEANGECLACGRESGKHNAGCSQVSA